MDLPRRKDQGRSRGHDEHQDAALVWLDEQAEVGRGWDGRGQVKVKSGKAGKRVNYFQAVILCNYTIVL